MAQNDTVATISNQPSREKLPTFMVWGVILVFSLLFIPTFQYFWIEWNRSHSPFGYGYLVPPTVLYMLWCKRKRIREQEVEPGHWVSLLGLLIGGLLLYIGIRTSINIILNAAFFVMLMSIPLYLWGLKVYRTIWGPIAFIATMIPWPDQLTSIFLVPAQVFSAKSASWVLSHLGQANQLEGTKVVLDNYTFEVAKACSGLTIVFPVIAIAILNMMMVDAKLRTKLAVIVLSVPISMFANLLRIVLVGAIGNNGGTELADKLHDPSGIVGVVLAVVLLTVLQWRLKAMTFFDDYMPSFAQHHDEEPASEPESEANEGEEKL